MKKIKVGDVIELGLMITDGGYSKGSFLVGTIRPVISIDRTGLYYFRSNRNNRQILPLIKDTEVKIVARMRITALKVKVGDRVKIAESSEYYRTSKGNPTCGGTVYNIRNREVLGTPALPVYVRWDNDETNAYAHKDLINLGKHG